MKAPHRITYNVAGHTFRIGYDGTTADESILPSLKKFQTEDTAGADLLFELSIVGTTVGEGECHEIGQFDCGGCNHGVYRTDEGGYLFCISDASSGSSSTLAKIRVTKSSGLSNGKSPYTSSVDT